MKNFLESSLLRAAVLLVGVMSASFSASAATKYVVTNDDMAQPFTNGVSFYAVGSDGSLTLRKQVLTGGFGIGGGFFGTNRISVLNSGGQQCVFASEAATGDIVGINVSTLKVGGSATGSPSDAGTSNGIGLANNGQYLFASFTDSNTIGAFSVQSGCGLTFLADAVVGGLAGGTINAMAVHGNILIATYTDGSLESFDVSAGAPVSHGDKQYSTATLFSQESTYPNAVDITSDGHYAIFGTTSTSFAVEVSDISSGKLAKTVVNKFNSAISSSNIMLSPDETMLYVINTQGASVSALFFNKATGGLTTGCSANNIRGLSVNYSYLVGLAPISNTGNGGGVYFAEFGSTSGVGMVNLTASAGTCSLAEAAASPFNDPNTGGLLSIGSFPPRAF
jgi:6-phosphogluconolactonase (cycloisomerase 2 family)